MSNSFAIPWTNTMDYSSPGSSVHEILQARILVWVATSFSRGSSDPGIEYTSPALAGRFFSTEPPEKSSLTFTLSKWISGFPCGSTGKESACNVGDLGSIPGLGRSPGEGKGYPLQYSILENSMDCIVHRVTKRWMQLRSSSKMVGAGAMVKRYPTSKGKGEAPARW